MTFVAQPYERFVDDLLIALTGGTIREEHEFVGIDQAYALGSPGVAPDSVRVFGQRDDAFALFERGVDYRYDATEDAILWEVGGRPPDDRTYFYVSYYRGEGEPRLTDKNPGSVTTTLAEAFSRQFGVLHKQMQLIYESAFVDFAIGSALDHVAALLSITRKDAKFASGEVLFKRNTPAPGDISIPAGTVVSTQLGQNFETTDRRTLRRDQLSVVSPIWAQIEGAPGRVEARQIVTVNRPIFGIEEVLNERPTFFAAERETDEELRRRIKGNIERAGRSTVDAIRFSLIDEVPQLDEANVSITERPDVPGFVDVRLGIAHAADPELVRRVEQSIFNSRPAGVRVRHNLATETPPPGVPPAIGGVPLPAVAPDSPAAVAADLRAVGAPEPASVVPPAAGAADEAVVPLQVEVLLRLTERNLSLTDKERVSDAVRTTVVAYIAGVPMGALLVYNKLLSRIVQPDDIADAALLVRLREAPDGEAEYRANLDSVGRKFTVAPEDVFVELMEQTVYVDVRALLEVRPAAQSAAGAAAPQVTDALRTSVRGAVEGALAATAGAVSRDEVRSAVGEALSASAPTLNFVEGDAIVVNAEFEETGRLLDDASEVRLAQHEVAVLRNLSIEILGPLDG